MDYTDFEKQKKAEEKEIEKKVEAEVEKVHEEVEQDERKLQEAEGPQPGGGEPSGHS